MKIVFYNETLISGGIEKCLELLSKSLHLNFEIEIVYIDDSKVDENIVKILSKYAHVHKLTDTEIVNADICVWCRIYFDYAKLSKQIHAERNFLWIHSKPHALPNCILDNKDFMEKVEKIICVSETVKKEAGFNDNAVVIHNFVNENIKELADKIENPFLNIPSNFLKLLIVSRLSSEKGFDRVEQIVKDLIKIDSNFVLKIIGKGRKSEAFIRSTLSKYKQIEFLGYTDNPYPYIKNCDYVMVLSNYETWGNVITEAKALGTPCIVTNFPSAKEQIVDGKNGIILPVDCNNYIPYLQNLQSRKIDLKRSLKDFKYINEIDKWYQIFSSNF